MKYRSILSALVIVALSCAEESETNPDSFPPLGRDEVAIRSVNVINFTPTKVELELKLNLLYYYRYGGFCLDKAWGDYVLNYGDKLPSSAFQFDAFDGDFDYQTELKSVTRQSPNPSTQAYSALLLVENTLDFPLTQLEDPYSNRRFEALNYFFLKNQSPNNFALAAFGKNGKMGSDVKFCAGFNEPWQTYASEAIKLSEMEGGTNNILDALTKSIDYVVNNATNPNKAIVVLTHTPPDYPYSKYLEVVQKAILNKVTIHIIDLNYHGETEIFGFNALALKTGGFYISAGPAGGSYPVFGFGATMVQLSEMLNRQYQEYVMRIEIKYTGTDPTYFETGYIYPHIIQMGYFKTNDRTDCGTKIFLEEFEYNFIPYVFSL
ncbi:MAG: VWA domain-containing protein [Cyclobacteriaceae bacterium]|nr:VWA domain-containing protein [Cyclobacteriaceae bacterium]